MNKTFGIFGVLGIISLYPIQSFSESWDLGYASADTVVEEIPETISEDDSIGDSSKPDLVEVTDLNDAPSTASLVKISTAKKTYGVDTVEKSGLKFYLAPSVGFTSILGNNTVEVTPQYAFGGRAGLLFSDNLMLEAGYTYSLMYASSPINPFFGVQNADLYSLKQGSIDLGGRFFFLGRESRFRPFIGGGLAYTDSGVNYSPNYSMFMNAEDFKIKQIQGSGQLGAEIAITRAVVATASFRLNGVLSTSTKAFSSAGTASGVEAGRLQAGDSLSRSASYTGSLGLGVYF